MKINDATQGQAPDGRGLAPGGAGRRWALAGLALAIVACQPTVRVEPPKEPIVVNLNVKIEHEVRVKVEKDVEALFEDNPDLF